ncbi:MAG: uroporphyrinogen-III C-methyltransferase [Planctomycetales bacterium]
MSHGKVYLVGAGPGDPGLLTLQGREVLARADLVLYDGLVNPLLLVHTQARAVRTCRSAAPGQPRLDQHEINAQLVAAARAGLTVVRLKGGDPFIFGRGAEEAVALAAAGIEFEIVPGVTAAVAASAYAGIPLTHRDCSSAVALITGHEDPAKPESALDYDALARFPGTLVFYMGLHRLPTIAQRLIEHGKPADSPTAVICRGTTPAQQTVTAPLSQIAHAARQNHLHAPSVIIVGECVRQRELIGWFEQRPLFGRRIAITRPIDQSRSIIDRLYALGAQPVLLPTIQILPPEEWTAIDQTLSRLSEYDWIVFTSVNGVRFLLDRLWRSGGDARRLRKARLAAIGDGTAQALEEFHLHADLIPEAHRAEGLAAALAPQVVGRRVLWARANRGRDVLPRELRAAGATLDELVVYRNVDVTQLEPQTQALLDAGEVDWITLSSPSTVRALASLLPAEVAARLGTSIRLASISPVTSAAASDLGWPIAAEATTHSWEGLLQGIIQAESAR